MFKTLFALALSFYAAGSFGYAAGSSGSAGDSRAQLHFRLLNPELIGDQKAYQFLEDVESLLPPALKNTVNHEVKIRFQDLSKKSKKNEGMKGMVKKGFFTLSKNADTILLDHSVLEMVKNPAASAGNKHKNNYQYALAILLHETAHLYDFKGKIVGADKEMFRACASDVMNGVASRKERRLCEKIIKRDRTISDSPLFLNLAGWNKTGALFKRRKQYNQNVLRSPDPYELENKQEFFAVNFEFFILDENFKCRRPGLYKYFEKAFGHRPYPGSDCEMSAKILMSQEAWQGKNARYVDLDPKRVYQIHYLFAGEGKAIMSRWGHSMIRVVTCSPRRKEVGPDCLKDIAHHVVLSYRANIADTGMSYMKGLNGEYDSMMFTLSMNDVVEEYTKGEFRDVFSVPMKLTEEEKTNFIHTALEQYWGYRGSYYFITNNCSTETLKLIRLAFQDDVEIQELTTITPLGLYEKLDKLNVSKMEVLADEKEAIKKGYLFKGMHKKLDQAFEELAAAIHMPFEDYEDYVKNSFALQRRDIFAEVSEAQGLQNRKVLLARLFKLEAFISDRSMLSFMKKLADDVFKAEREGALDPSLFDAINDFQEIQQSMLPEKTVQSGYGIPLVSETKMIDQYMMDNIQDGIRGMGEIFFEWAQDKYPEDIEQMKLTGENKRILLKMFRQSM